MKVVLNVVYESGADPNVEASKLDKFRRRLYGVGTWRRSGGSGLEITL